MTTRLLGSFPTHLETIIGMIRSARTDIQILAPCPAYASFSAPGLFREYCEALVEARERGVKITLVTARDELLREMDRNQMSRVYARRTEDGSAEQDSLREFLACELPEQDPASTAIEVVLDRLAELDHDTLARVFVDCKVVATGEELLRAMPAWVVDGRSGVFTTSSRDPFAAPAFASDDPALIAQLCAAQASFSRDSHPA